MEMSVKLLRKQLMLLKPFVSGSSLYTARMGQDRLGALMSTLHKNEVLFDDIKFDNFDAVMIIPKDEAANGVILYLHGGGYTCGDLDYAKGFGTILAAKCNIHVFCAAYRLAPESVFPAAVDDALTAYRHLLKNGYSASDIVLCGESAGGGLIYSLCLKLKSLGEPLPAGIIAISPWTDLTSSGESYDKNKDVDPSMTRERLKYFSDCYIHGDKNGIKNSATDIKLKQNPLVSPLFGELTGMPPSLIFVGGDEVMLDDSRLMHEKLLASGCRSMLVITPDMWHAYVLYCLHENDEDFNKIRAFLRSVLPHPKKLRWMKLDNAAKIYPATKRRDWSNVFRLSATLCEDIDRDIMKSALDVTVRRFPSIAVRLRRGVFWYYIEEIKAAPDLIEEKSFPLARMPFDDIRKCAFRVIVYKNRVAVEFFHALTDGNGGLVFLKTLAAEYLTEKYNIKITPSDGVLDRLEEPSDEELEDSFPEHSGPLRAGRGEPTAYNINGTPETDGFRTNITFILSAAEIAEGAKSRGVSVTSYLTAAMICAIAAYQARRVPQRRRRPIKILIPVDLRRLYGSRTLRNFVLYVTPGIDPRLGEYSFDEVCKIVYYQMKLEITEKRMSMRIAANVGTEQMLAVKILPLFIKNIVMKAVFNAIGERKSCFSLSNLGIATLPPEMTPYVKRMDFVLDVQSKSPYNCGVITYGDTLYFNIIRDIKESELELDFYRVLRGLGVGVKVESNSR